VSTLSAEANKVAALRLALPAMSAGVYLNTGTSGPLPAETAAAMAELADWELRLGRASPDTYFDVLQRMEEARASIAAIIAADTRDIALTHAASEALNVAAWGIDWRAGDRAVSARNFEDAGLLSGLYAVRDRLGVEVDLVDLGHGGDHDRILAVLDAAIRPGTRLVSMSHVSHATGAVLPIAEIAELAHARGALLAVDGSQAVGAIPVDVAALGADLYAIAGQKWLLGPEGTGALYIAPSALEQIRLTYASFWSFEEQDMAGSARPWSSARRFEGTGGVNHSLVVGLARSCGWLSMYVGLGWALERGAALARQTADELASISGVILVTPREAMAGLVTFRVAGWSAQAILDELSARTFVIARVIEALDALRFSVGWFNTHEELERVLRLVAELAAHTPESMPPRRTLTILDVP
jgi:L-cysteine/cystine lyase